MNIESLIINQVLQVLFYILLVIFSAYVSAKENTVKNKAREILFMATYVFLLHNVIEVAILVISPNSPFVFVIITLSVPIYFLCKKLRSLAEF